MNRLGTRHPGGHITHRPARGTRHGRPAGTARDIYFEETAMYSLGFSAQLAQIRCQDLRAEAADHRASTGLRRPTRPGRRGLARFGRGRRARVEPTARSTS